MAGLNSERNQKVYEKATKGGMNGDVGKIALLADISASLANIADSLHSIDLSIDLSAMAQSNKK